MNIIYRPEASIFVDIVQGAAVEANQWRAVTFTVDGSTSTPTPLVHFHTFTPSIPIHDAPTMTDLTPTLNQLLSTKNGPSISNKSRPSPETADEFLKEAYRIVSPPAPPKQDSD